jgi:hypothetical protein
MAYTQNQLEAAFDKVSNKFDWKNPIDYCCLANDLPVIVAAIQHFTGTETEFKSLNDGYYSIKSIGYRAGPAGDH